MTDNPTPGPAPDDGEPVDETAATREIPYENHRLTRDEDDTLHGRASGPDPVGLPRISATATGLESTFEILDVIGEGGMGIVYSARNLALGRIVALKVLRSLGSARDGERFLLEARALAKIDHHNVVTVYHVGRRGDSAFIEMQHVDGESLDRRLARGPVPPDEAVRIVEQVAHALSHAHARGLIHRDIKPSNILVTNDGIVKVVDFGLALPLEIDASLTQEGHVVGTPIYMAPEQWKGRTVDARSDLYLLGVTFWELLVGRPPFEGTLAELMHAHVSLRPVPACETSPTIPSELSRIVEKLLEKEPESRYASASELITDLRLFEQGLAPEVGTASPSPDEPVAAEETPRRSGWRGTVAVAALVATAVLLLGALDVWRRPELLTEDLRLAWTSGGSGPEAAEVAVVVIDSASKDELAPGRPLSRSDHHSVLLQSLLDLEARAIGVDLLFHESISPQEDDSLAAATALAPQTVHAASVTPHTERIPDSDPAILEPRWSLRLDETLRNELPTAGRVDWPIRSLREASAHVGHVALEVDPDGVIRRLPVGFIVGNRMLPSLSLAAVLAAWNVEPSVVTYREDALVIPRADGSSRSIPIDPGGRLRLNPRWSSAGIPAIRLVDALSETPDPAVRAALTGRVVFVGSQLDGDYDVGPLPGRPVAPLVWAHAIAADSILRGEFVRPVSALSALLGVLAISLSGAFLARLPSLWALLALPAATGVIWLLAFVAAGGSERTLVPLVAWTFALLGSGIGVVLWRAIVEDRERRRLAGLLSRYLSPGVTRRLLLGAGPLQIGGKRRELSLLCVKIHDFARISERLEPEEVDELLRLFFERATDLVFRHEGTLDSFSGDGLRAFFGDPEPQADHAERAVLCALELRRECTEALSVWQRKGRPALTLGIGVHTGYVTVGNIGSAKRMEYTALGRNVELAEELARRACGAVRVSERTRALTSDRVSYQAASGGDPASDREEPLDPGNSWNAVAPV